MRCTPRVACPVTVVGKSREGNSGTHDITTTPDSDTVCSRQLLLPPSVARSPGCVLCSCCVVIVSFSSLSASFFHSLCFYPLVHVESIGPLGQRRLTPPDTHQSKQQSQQHATHTRTHTPIAPIPAIDLSLSCSPFSFSLYE